MHLYLQARLVTLHVSDHYFFRMAHQWKFGRDVNPERDVWSYRHVGVIPSYVVEYVKELQRKEMPCEQLDVLSVTEKCTHTMPLFDSLPPSEPEST
jgi:hypothetical protein